MKTSYIIDEGLDAIKRSFDNRTDGLIKPFYTCRCVGGNSHETFFFQSLDDCLKVARFMSIGMDSATPSFKNLVKVSHVPSYAIALAYIKTIPSGKQGHVSLSYYLASDGLGCTEPVSVDVIKALADGSFIDRAEFARRKLDKEFDRVMSEPCSGLGKDILIPGLPETWYEWNLEIEQRTELLCGEGLNKGLIVEFHATNLTDALAILFNTSNRKVGLLYHIYSCTPNNEMRWYADWPINRRGSMENVFCSASDNRNHLHLVNQSGDTAVMIVYNKRDVSAFGTKNVYRMCVGGVTQEEAIENWATCAGALRRIMKAH